MRPRTLPFRWIPMLMVACSGAPLTALGAQSYPLSEPQQAALPAVRTTSDGSWVAYSVNRGIPGLFSVPAAGQQRSVKLSTGPLSAVLDAEITPDARRVVYRADEDAFDRFELYSVPIRGGQPIRLSRPVGGTGASGDVESFRLAPDGKHVAFLSTLLGSSAMLYSVPPDGTGPAILLDAASRPAIDLQISPDGSRVVYRAGDFNAYDLYSVRIDGSQPPLKMNAGYAGDTLAYRIDAASARVAFVMLLSGTRKLLSAALDGSSPPIQLDAPGGDVNDFQLTPDGSGAVYLADETIDEQYELYLAPIDGSLPPMPVTAPLPPWGDVQPYALLGDLEQGNSVFRLAPDGSRAVYLADQDANEVLELYSVPLDGSRLAVKLNDPLVAGGDVRFGPSHGHQRMEITRDGGRVVYLADRDVDEVVELYSVPIDGSAPPVELNDSLGNATLRDVLDFRLTSDGRQVIYRANEDLVWSIDLLAVPVDGSRRSRTLNGPAAVHGWQIPAEYLITPGSDLVLYQSDEDHDGTQRLYAAPLPKARRGPSP